MVETNFAEQLGQIRRSEFGALVKGDSHQIDRDMNVILAPIEPDLGGSECTNARDTSGHSKHISEIFFEWSQDGDVKKLSRSQDGSEWIVRILVYVVR